MKFIVIVNYMDPSDDVWDEVFVWIDGAADAQDAANEACLYLLSTQSGKAEPLWIIEGWPAIVSAQQAVFDAEEYDETITHAGVVKKAVWSVDLP